MPQESKAMLITVLQCCRWGLESTVQTHQKQNSLHILYNAQWENTPGVLLYGSHSFLKTEEKHLYESNKEPCSHIWSTPFNKITEQARQKKENVVSFLQTQLGEGRGSCMEHCSERGNAPSLDSLGFAPFPWDPHQVISREGLSKLIFPWHHRSLKGMYRSRGQMPGSVLLNTLLAGGGGNINHSWICSSFTPFIFSYFYWQWNS